MKPIEFGADIVVHSLTKYMGGHGTSIGGIIVDSGKFPWAEHKDRFPMLSTPEPAYHGVVYTEALGPAAFIGRARTVPLRNMGSAISPFNAFLFLQGIETLALRMERHVSNAMAVADHLEKHPSVSWVSYAGLKSSPYYQLAQKYTKGRPSALLTFGIKGGFDAGVKFYDALEDLQAAREHRRREVAGGASGVDDAPSADGRGAEDRRCHAGHDSTVRRHRGHRRHSRGHRPGAGQSDELKVGSASAEPRARREPGGFSRVAGLSSCPRGDEAARLRAKGDRVEADACGGAAMVAGDTRDDPNRPQTRRIDLDHVATLTRRRRQKAETRGRQVDESTRVSRAGPEGVEPNLVVLLTASERPPCTFDGLGRRRETADCRTPGIRLPSDPIRLRHGASCRTCSTA